MADGELLYDESGRVRADFLAFILSGDGDPSRTTRALALEVLAGRERRCGNCTHFMDDYHVCRNGHYHNGNPSWHCADFTRKEER